MAKAGRCGFCLLLRGKVAPLKLKVAEIHIAFYLQLTFRGGILVIFFRQRGLSFLACPWLIGVRRRVPLGIKQGMLNDNNFFCRRFRFIGVVPASFPLPAPFDHLLPVGAAQAQPALTLLTGTHAPQAITFVICLTNADTGAGYVKKFKLHLNSSGIKKRR